MKIRLMGYLVKKKNNGKWREVEQVRNLDEARLFQLENKEWELKCVPQYSRD